MQASTTDVMSQKSTTDAVALKLDKASVKTVTGTSATDVMSQKAVTDAVALKLDRCCKARCWVNRQLTS